MYVSPDLLKATSKSDKSFLPIIPATLASAEAGFKKDIPIPIGLSLKALYAEPIPEPILSTVF